MICTAMFEDKVYSVRDLWWQKFGFRFYFETIVYYTFTPLKTFVNLQISKLNIQEIKKDQV